MFGCSALPFIYSHASVGGGLHHPDEGRPAAALPTVPRGEESVLELSMNYIRWGSLSAVNDVVSGCKGGAGEALQISFRHICYFLVLSRVKLSKAIGQMQLVAL